MKTCDISELRHLAGEFGRRLDQIKSEASPNVDWYPYHSLTNFVHLDSLLTGTRRNLASLIDGGRVLDVGCADGDIAFFLESLGFGVTAIDHPRSNHSGMAGLRSLSRELKSGVEILELDLDSQFSLGQARYGLVFLLGALYHLKNPFYVLETLSKHARYCLLSTRVMRFLPGGQIDASGFPVAYLLSDTELNADNSNFWIFSEMALRRLLCRSNWRVLDYMTVGPQDSDPVSESDQRAFCLVQSTYGLADVQLVRGWHEPEQEGWRWTERIFEAHVHPAQAGKVKVSMRLFVPAAVIERFGTITLQARADGQDLAPETYSHSGEFRFERCVIAGGPIHLFFALDQALLPDHDNRERGIIVASLQAE